MIPFEKFSCKENVSLAEYTSFHLGGRTRYFCAVRSVDEIKYILGEATRLQLPYMVLGGGSNMLISDAGFAGVALKLDMRAVTIDGTSVRAEAGAVTAEVARATIDAGLAGFEWAAGIPGTIGGAVRGNAGASGGEIKDVVESVDVLDTKSLEVCTTSLGDCGFAYRKSVFKGGNDIIIGCTLRLEQGQREAGLKKMVEHLRYRNDTQPKKYGSTGCIFKNVEFFRIPDESLGGIVATLKAHGAPQKFFDSGRVSSGWLVQEAGLKGYAHGGAAISDVHGNFVVNTGSATAAEVKQLIQETKLKVRDTFGIMLEEEIEYIGFL